MAESITLEPGARVRQQGTSYRVVDTSIIEGELIEVKAQKNRHALAGCFVPSCVESQKEQNDGKPYPLFRSGARKRVRMPHCPNCGEAWTWASNEPDAPDTEV